MTWILCAIFFLSGASALTFETLWFHQTGLVLGNGVLASSLVLSGFMAGLALGNLAAARFGERSGHPVRAYAGLELAIAITGVALVFGLPALSPGLAAIMGPLVGAELRLNALRLAVAFALLLVPSTAMGATLPLLAKALCTSERFGPVLGRLYGWNTLGAVAGVVAAEVLLVDHLGIRGSALLAGGVNLAAALTAWLLAGRLPAGAPRPIGTGVVALRRGARWLAAAFLSGFGLLALEVVWFRFLSLYVPGDALSLAVMLATVLAGIGGGGFVAGAWLARAPGAHRAAAAVAGAAGVCCIAGYALFPAVATELGAGRADSAVAILRMALPLMFPVALLSGVLFTLLGAALREVLPSETAAVGMLTFANTVGAALGSLAAGFVLLPALGMERALFTLALLYGLTGALALSPTVGARRAALAAASALAVAAALFPFGAMVAQHLRAAAERWVHGGTAEVALVREGTAQTILYLDRRELGVHHSYRLLTNGYSMSGNDVRSRRYMKLYVYLPVAVHPGLESALLISYGVGSTARALVDTAELERIDVVDISREILEASDVVFPDPTTHPLRDPRVTVHVEDGRYFLQTTPRRFDLITSEPPPPREAGVVNLYTQEYFEQIHERLTEGGIATYWLPLHSLNEVSARSILHAFCNAFDDCSLWNGNGYDLMMVGTRGARGPVSAERFTAQWRDPVVSRELREIGLERPEQLGALFIAGPDFLRAQVRDTPPLVDDRPRRILAKGLFPKQLPEDYRLWRDTAASAARFRESPLVAGLWPEPLRTDSVAYFEVQTLINLSAYTRATPLDRAIAGLHDVLTHTDLESPVLWALDSDADVQRVVAQADPALPDEPGVAFHRAAGLLAERRFAAAAEAFARAEVHPEWGRDAFRLRVYALCLDGRVEVARSLARERYARAGAPAGLPPFWAWLKRTFDVDPAAGATAAPQIAVASPAPAGRGGADR
jgi:spermidine synthase